MGRWAGEEGRHICGNLTQSHNFGGRSPRRRPWGRSLPLAESQRLVWRTGLLRKVRGLEIARDHLEPKLEAEVRGGPRLTEGGAKAAPRDHRSYSYPSLHMYPYSTVSLKVTQPVRSGVGT